MEKTETFKLKYEIFSKTNPLIIAEIGTSHNGDLARAKVLIDEAKSAGATAVKFQIIYADEILHPKTGKVKLPTGNISLYDRFKELEMPIEFYQKLASYSKNLGLLFSASPFGFRSAKELVSLRPDFLKIASPELNYIQLLEYCAGFNIPMILSTGVSKLSDIEKGIAAVVNKNATLPVAILHCVTAYPAPEDSYNISVIENLKNIFNLPVGLSDHSMDPVLVPALSICFGACIIEKHICLSRKESGLDDPVALEPDQFKQMCDVIKQIMKYSKKEIIEELIKLKYTKNQVDIVTGSGEKKLSEAEKNNYGRTNRSIHYTKDLNKNSFVGKEDIAILRTEKELSVGEPPDKFDCFIGAVLEKNVNSGDGVLFSDFIKRM